MGGHGGLNILPQKSWNVYRNDNREKVRRDEAEHAASEKLKREQQLDVEQEERLALLRARKRQRDAGAEALDTNAAPADPPLTGGAVAGAIVVAPSAGALVVPAAQHVNLFAEAEEEERKREAEAGDEEYMREKAEEEKQLLKKMCIGLGTSNPQQGREGDVSHNPWWTQHTQGDELQLKLRENEQRLERQEEERKSQRKKEKKAKKKKEKEKKEKKKQAQREGKLLTSSGKTIEELRKERLARETTESARALEVGRPVAPPKPAPITKYDSGFFKAESRTNKKYASHLAQGGRAAV